MMYQCVLISRASPAVRGTIRDRTVSRLRPQTLTAAFPCGQRPPRVESGLAGRIGRYVPLLVNRQQLAHKGPNRASVFPSKTTAPKRGCFVYSRTRQHSCGVGKPGHQLSKRQRPLVNHLLRVLRAVAAQAEQLALTWFRHNDYRPWR